MGSGADRRLGAGFQSVRDIDAPFYGSTGNGSLNKPAVGIMPAFTGDGYRLVGGGGGVFDFGSAGFYGSGVTHAGEGPPGATMASRVVSRVCLTPSASRLSPNEVLRRPVEASWGRSATSSGGTWAVSPLDVNFPLATLGRLVTIVTAGISSRS